MTEPKDRIIAALDVPGEAEARRFVSLLSGEVGMFKVGSQLFTAAGPGLVRDLTQAGHGVFLDLKFHDIPNTVAGAVAQAAKLGVRLVDVHALGGLEMMQAAARAARDSPTQLLGITILTSHDEASLRRVGLEGPVETAVVRLALLAREAGLHGVVASPREVEALRRACGEDFLVVTPGIRSATGTPGDQARVATAASAIRSGADFVVVGRPFLEAGNPRAAARQMAAEIG